MLDARVSLFAERGEKAVHMQIEDVFQKYADSRYAPRGACIRSFLLVTTLRSKWQLVNH